MLYQLLLPREVRFGWGRRRELAEMVRRLGRRAVLVTGSRTLEARGVYSEIMVELRHSGLEGFLLASIDHEPTVDDVDAATASFLSRKVCDGDVMVAVGGGAAIDLAKAVSAMIVNGQDVSVREFLEGVGSGRQIELPPLPLVVLPTTAGTGSEATRNAVITGVDPPFKKSLRSSEMVPRGILIDPELCCTCPPSVTASSGMDAITQLVESFITRKSQPVTRALCLEGLRRAPEALRRLHVDPLDRPAREWMSHAAFLSGVALANSGLGMAHGVAAALGALAGVPHGLACAIMLPVAMRANLEVAARDFAEIGNLWRPTASGPLPSAEADLGQHALEVIQQLAIEIGIPQSLRSLGIEREQIGPLVVASRGNSMNGNPREISDEELTSLLNDLW